MSINKDKSSCRVAVKQGRTSFSLQIMTAMTGGIGIFPHPLYRLDADVPSYGRKRCRTTLSHTPPFPSTFPPLLFSSLFFFFSFPPFFSPLLPLSRNRGHLAGFPFFFFFQTAHKLANTAAQRQAAAFPPWSINR